MDCEARHLSRYLDVRIPFFWTCVVAWYVKSGTAGVHSSEGSGCHVMETLNGIMSNRAAYRIYVTAQKMVFCFVSITTDESNIEHGESIIEDAIGEEKMEWLDAQEQKAIPGVPSREGLTRQSGGSGRKGYLHGLLNGDGKHDTVGIRTASKGHKTHGARANSLPAQRC